MVDFFGVFIACITEIWKEGRRYEQEDYSNRPGLPL